MSLRKTIKSNEFCSRINKNINFYIVYEPFNYAGNMGTVLTKMELECPYMMKCGIDSAIDCPFFHKAPEDIHLP